ncbi:MAG TPA: nucleotide sugar dehydrogenase [Pseudonocardiaceae bacterium]|nr:nucleotide sugar dehydrogenase [Pseudonocardiaceae bacterium]
MNSSEPTIARTRGSTESQGEGEGFAARPAQRSTWGDDLPARDSRAGAAATADLVSRIVDRSAHVVVVGQGYVGLSLSCAAAERGFSLVGLDVDADRVAELNAGRLTVPGVSDDEFAAAGATGLLRFTSDPAAIESADVVVICVPTPLKDHVPDLSFVDMACTTIARHLAPGTLVVMESTTYPGTTDEVVRPVLESSGLRAGRDFRLAYCPERIDPGNRAFGLARIPRVIGGIDEASISAASAFYGQFVDRIVTVSSCRTAELAKLLENTFRHVNIALVNEMAMLCHETRVDIWEVIQAAASKPFGFMPFYPGPGVGGHCIPLDPTYLAWQMRRDVGHQFRILEQSQDINAQMPDYVGSRIAEMLNDAGKAVNGAHVLVLGVAYKPGVGDVRESPSLKVMNWLLRRGATVRFHDPYVGTVALNGRRLDRTELDEDSLRTADCVALLTPHPTYDLNSIADTARLIFDARNAYGDHQHSNVVAL